jgi:hypothetical protein
MTTSTDAYWDELGVAWRAVNPDMNVISSRIRLRLRSQAACAYALVIFGVPLSIAALALGAFTIWKGFSAGAWNFVVRGIAVIVIGLLLGFAGWSQRIGARAETSTLAQMIDLAIVRAQKLRQAVVVGICICAVAAAFGLLGYAIRSHIGRAPAMSPFEPLTLLALLSTALLLYVRRASDDLKKLRYLQRALAPELVGQ